MLNILFTFQDHDGPLGIGREQLGKPIENRFDVSESGHPVRPDRPVLAEVLVDDLAVLEDVEASNLETWRAIRVLVEVDGDRMDEISSSLRLALGWSDSVGEEVRFLEPKRRGDRGERATLGPADDQDLAVALDLHVEAGSAVVMRRASGLPAAAALHRFKLGGPQGVQNGVDRLAEGAVGSGKPGLCAH